MLQFGLLRYVQIVAASPSHSVSIRAGRRERSDRTRPNLFDAMLACRTGDRPGGFVQPERLRATNDSARGSPGGRLLVQQAAAGSRPQSGCRGTPGASAPSSAPAQGEAETAHDGGSAQACSAEACIDAGAHRAVHCRPGASAAARQCVPTSATNVGIAVPATAGDAITPGKTRRARRFREKFWTIRALSGTLG
jgi:hypothetical protein